ncbi:MAG: [FeFe] hydrogenase H-cluster radical SAM maturase HydE [Treponema sp.]|jgi:biotin synthase|nr:[FeFe] hydrogenase H-cluster radical SAM maturase HydE [Treponema sp.]
MQLNDDELLRLITTEDKSEIESLFAQARKAREDYYGKSIYFRGLIEFTNYCKNDCYYCGIRCSNSKLERYRLSQNEILDCCRRGDKLGYKTFVLQGGEDPWFSDERLAQIISAIRSEFPEHAITLSIGEHSRGSYELFFREGANRFLLRHETSSVDHYAKLHPPSMTLENRKRCLRDLKETGYQTGAGFMVGTPHQTLELLLADLRYLEELQPEMAGVGPFIPHKDTPFAAHPAGNLSLSLKMLALVRIILPKALIPATTAISTIASNGRELALNAGANVIMPNLTPQTNKKLYQIYDHKLTDEDDAVENHLRLVEMIRSAGLEPDMGRGDAKR